MTIFVKDGDGEALNKTCDGRPHSLKGVLLYTGFLLFVCRVHSFLTTDPLHGRYFCLYTLFWSFLYRLPYTMIYRNESVGRTPHWLIPCKISMSMVVTLP